ncbi:hypothetical protein K6V33_04430 [Streptococcus suis]|nr:hypothetical protein [Streptococcus suis]MBY5022080.1 hypothetical protein [Streptococcus suis]MCQ8265412.1 hypothetical protein [Streptococcus suis]HEL1639604.1 hypothetical protein [Streptococcus suis]HEL9645496.1 hypothetical protein [Streptococcus suis]
MKTKKAYWLTLLLVAVVLFLLGLNTGVYVFNLLAIGISFLVYRNGYDVLFKEYDDSQKEKRETAEKIYAALREGKKKDE